MKTKIQPVELPVATVAGQFIARYSETGLVELDWPKNEKRKAESRKRKHNPAIWGLFLPTKIRSWHRLTEAALKKVLAGRAFRKLPPLDWTGKTKFQKSVWRALLKIAPGKTKSYGEIARAVGRPKAVRAVGGACSANPVPVLVPCHRVLAANHKLGGYSGGLDRKRRLLEREGIKI